MDRERRSFRMRSIAKTEVEKDSNISDESVHRSTSSVYRCDGRTSAPQTGQIELRDER